MDTTPIIIIDNISDKDCQDIADEYKYNQRSGKEMRPCSGNLKC